MHLRLGKTASTRPPDSKGRSSGRSADNKQENKPENKSAENTPENTPGPGPKGFDPEVNPYSLWVHDYPRVLLAEPSPKDLNAKMAGAPAADGPIVCDLGCGSGNFLLQMAAAHPEKRFAGFELRYKRLVKAARKVERAELKNVWFLREQAERFPRYFDPGSVEEVYINFPDPWQKYGQWKHRMVNADFLRELTRILVPGGRFYLKTDHSGYFLHTLSLLKQVPALEIRAFRNDLLRTPRPGRPIRSEFEDLFRSRRRPIHYLVMEYSSAKR